MAEHELTLERMINAPVERVWQAWTDPEQLKQWWGPDGFTIPECEVDVRVGGTLDIVMEDSAGLIKKGSRYPMTGTFQEIAPARKLVFAASAVIADKPVMDSLTTVTFEEMDGRTRLTVHVEVTRTTPEAAGPLAGMEMGWNQQLDKLVACYAA